MSFITSAKMVTRTLGLFCFLLILVSLELTFSQTICPTGKWGTICTLNCNATCAKNCEKEKGTCFGCKTGWFDSYCNHQCTDCEFGCAQETGLCECDVFGCSICASNPGECDTCDGTKTYIPSSIDSLRCCSEGCKRDADGVVDCQTNGVCILEGCGSGFWGDTCTQCSQTIENCDLCELLQNSDILICTQCQTGYERSVDRKRCCKPGCDDCVGDVCSVCKSGYYIYGTTCDTCGTNCQTPPTGPPAARCNAVTGNCLYGCLQGWHGSKCNVQCTLEQCKTCAYDEPNKLLTCQTCNEGYAPNLMTHFCEPCNLNCLDGTCNSTTGNCLNGCIDGWRGDRCDQSCADAGLGNCTACGRYGLTCSTCMFNNWGPVCEHSCSVNCVPNAGAHVCAKDTAACTKGCLPGYWNADCNNACPNCLTDVCDITTGVCTVPACKPGYWNPNCMTHCATDCANSPTAGVQECNFNNGFCTHGCKYNFYGDQCTMECNANCFNNRTTAVNPFDSESLCQQASGKCTYGCNNNYYTGDCSVKCTSTCVTGECDRQTGLCPACSDVPKGWKCYDGACPAGKHGQFCQANCTGGSNCLNKICNRFNGNCEGCVTDRWGDDCEFECNSCINGLCYQINGSCVHGCIAGTWGDSCEKSCHDRCSVCDQRNGSCIMCHPGRFGPVCERNCSQYCLPSSDGTITCNKETGFCDEGACKSGFYSLTCRSACNPNCAATKNGTVGCQINTGECLYGCDEGWFGSLCTEECLESCRNKSCIDQSDNCVYGCSDFYYGDRCGIRCSVGCQNGICDDYGYCIDGCQEEKFGNMCDNDCQETCIDSRCDRNTGRCEYCYNFTMDSFYLCKTANCTIGKYGQYCNRTCPGGDLCFGSICDRYTSICNGCETGFWGDFCQNNCSTCTNGTCNQMTGICENDCIDGYYGQLCQDKCVDRCDVCSRIDGSCIICSVGTYGPTCEYNCSSNCTLKDGKLLCDKNTGACSSGQCKAGYFGLSCTNQCFQHCLATGPVARCDYNTGYCTDGCKIGWYGLLCTGQCSSTCRNQHCFEDSNNCLDGCIDAFYGDRCLEPCNEGCYLGICDDYGYCKAGCIQEHYGDICTETCNTTCTDNNCDRVTGNCDECTKQVPGILCRTALCNPGLHGLFCNMSCLSNDCLDNRCNRGDGTCKGCKKGLYGPVCDKNCNNCISGACDQGSGKCLVGCIDGWYGDLCDQRCSSCVRCRQSSGICTECPEEKYGTYCEKNCSQNCQPTPTGFKSCDIYTAACASLACTSGYYGPDCENTCHINCRPNNNNEVLCDFNTGACLADCVPDFYGLNCHLSCVSLCHDKTCDRIEGICADCKVPPDCQDCLLPPNCPDALCNKTFWGQNCTYRCPERCDSRGCDRYTAKCFSCLPGYQGDKCNATCAYPGCYNCTQSTGLCEYCKAGKYGINCDKDCGGCATINGEVRCDKNTGSCLSSSCQPGRWGLDCASVCNVNCGNRDGKDICDKFSGFCSLGCDLSYYADFCNRTCSPKCKNKHCKASANDCQEGCAVGYYGLNSCLTPCSINCINSSCNENDGVCTEGCTDGFYMGQCSRACIETCINDKCHRETGRCPECTVTSANPYYFCRTKACESGLQGNLCDNPCPIHCAEACERYTGKCKGCDPGYYGNNCSKSCNNCLNSNCIQDTGFCNDGCMPGYYGNLCDQPCKFDGCETCDRQLGQCLTCKNELYGGACERNCSRSCTLSANNLHMCDKDTGTCLEGSCIAGWWGLDCFQKCNDNCKADAFESRSCYYQTGRCSSGCEDKYWDDQCDQLCSSTCQFQLCARDSTCMVGCVTGNYGPSCEFKCKDTCNDETCDRISGTCLECNKTIDQQTPLCRTAPCPRGSQGLLCNDPCPVNCLDICDRYDSTCAQCKSGFYGDLCNLTCGNCVGVSCNKTTGYCESGCLNEWYGPRCMKRCLDANCQTCDITTGTCSTCKPTFYGLTCNKTCSSFCAPGTDGRVRCNRTTGYCSAVKCLDGYYLEDCAKSCNEKCGSDFNNNRPCDILTGRCTYDCVPGWYGDSCDRPCSGNCVDNSCDRTGYCISGCKTGFYGGDCRLTCSPPLTCNDGTCHRINGNCSACDGPVPTPACRDIACPMGSYGLFCNETCPLNCKGGVCIRETGMCEECNLAWYGANCTSQCLNCQDDLCFKTSGECIKGCKDGFYTLKCNTRCLYEGCKDCTRDNGSCITCKVGKYNSECSADCSPYCAQTMQGLTCSKASGYCTAGSCVSGYWSEACTQECSEFCEPDECDLTSGSCSPCKIGHYGVACRQECSSRCKNKNCMGTFDTCVDGCANGYWGATCEKNCSQNCVQGICDINTGTCSLGCKDDMFYGPTCKEPCSSNCAGDGKCERDGFCRHGCKTGTYGLMCKNTCPDAAKCTDGTCDRTAGNCSECDSLVPGPLCPSADCPAGKWGTDCQDDCTSMTCLYNRCTRKDDICIGCEIGIYGKNCDTECGKCKVGTGCNQISGICDEGCRDGFYGEKCDQTCAAACQSCERYPPAQCVVCVDNRWGVGCTRNCSPNCAKEIVGSLSYTYCDKETGDCSEGACVDNRYWKANCSQTCPQNCKAINGIRQCRITDGQCTNGCEDTFFGPQCSGDCSVQCKNRICLNSANNCVKGCEAGFYNPPTCSGTCSQWCKTPSSCDPVTGSCVGGCAAGYFGDKCIEQCYGKCKDGTCDELGGCPDCRISPVGPLCHPQVCPALRYGPSCESDCPGLYCMDDTCHRQTGKCLQGCKTWYNGEYCTERCICDQAGTQSCGQDGVCTCKDGRTGLDCSQTCSDGCKNNVCAKNGQCTQGCITGRYGSQCEVACSNCIDEACDAASGNCQKGCKPGFYGSRCDESCGENCLSCESSTSCTQCLSFRYGLPACTQSCSPTCSPTSTGRVCSESTGACSNGCVTGYYGVQCDKLCNNCGGNGACSIDGDCLSGCKSGYFSSKCTTQCSLGCANSEGSSTADCHFASGKCTYGCEDGYYGDTCLECNANCLGKICSSTTICTNGCEANWYGKNEGCSKDCSDCKNGKCDDSGICQDGCQDGFYGPQCKKPCSKTCKDDTCDQTTGECADCSATPVGSLCRDIEPVAAASTTVEEKLSTNAIIGIAAGIAIAVISISILVTCCYYYRRQASDAKNTLNLPSDVLEGFSTHRSHHSTISSQYPVARVVGDDEKDFVLF